MPDMRRFPHFWVPLIPLLPVRAQISNFSRYAHVEGDAARTCQAVIFPDCKVSCGAEPDQLLQHHRRRSKEKARRQPLYAILAPIRLLPLLFHFLPVLFPQERVTAQEPTGGTGKDAFPASKITQVMLAAEEINIPPTNFTRSSAFRPLGADF